MFRKLKNDLVEKISSNTIINKLENAANISKAAAEEKLTKLYDLPSHEQFLKEAYRIFLNREIDPTGLSGGLNYLNNYNDRAALLVGLANSEEFALIKGKGICENRKFTCDWIFNTLVVLCDGKVVCGCADPYGMRPLGNLADNTIHEIWDSKLAQEIRAGLNAGNAPFCYGCGLKRFVNENDKIPVRPVVQGKSGLTKLFIEPTGICNLSCVGMVCNKDENKVSKTHKARNRSKFPLGEFKSLVDDVGSHVKHLSLFNYGEPFLIKESGDMVEYIKDNYPDIYLFTSTNGTLLDDEKIHKIVKSGMDHITISLDGVDQESYGTYRINGKFDDVFNNIKKIAEEKKRLGTHLPYITWRYILFKWNDSDKQMNKARRLAQEIGIDQLCWEITQFPDPSERFKPGTPDFEKIKFEIWTTLLGNAIEEKRFAAKIDLISGEIVVDACSPFVVTVNVKNIGGAYWRDKTTLGSPIVCLGAQLYDENKNPINVSYAYKNLSKALTKEMQEKVDIMMPGIEKRGEYFVKYDMVHKPWGDYWFENVGSQVAWMKVIVN